MLKLIKWGTLALGLVALSASTVWADAAAGKKMFSEKKCQACHYTNGLAKEKTIDDQLAKKGPELWYAGSKFQQPWLLAWLQDPQPIRLMKYNSVTEENPGNHAKLTAEEANPMADFLMSLTSDNVVAGVIKPKKNPKGKLIFKKKMPCGGCHQYVDRKKLQGGKTGPSLAKAGERLNPDWIYAYLKEPKIFKPVKAMPVFSGLMSDKDMKAVSAYVAYFK